MRLDFKTLVLHHIKWGLRSWVFIAYFFAIVIGLGVAALVDTSRCRQTVRHARFVEEINRTGTILTDSVGRSKSTFVMVIQPSNCQPGNFVPGFHGLSILIQPNRLPWLEAGNVTQEGVDVTFSEVFKVIVAIAGLLLGLGSFVLMRQDRTLALMLGNGFTLPQVWLSAILGRMTLALLAYMWTVVVLALEIAGIEGGSVDLGNRLIPLLGITGAGAVYLIVWVAIGLGISAFCRRWEQTLVIGILIWSTFIWILPSLALTVTHFLVPRPSPRDLIQEEIEGRNRVQILISRDISSKEIPSCRPPSDGDKAELKLRMKQCLDELNQKAQEISQRRFAELRALLARSYERFIGAWQAWWNSGRRLASVSPAFLWDEFTRSWNGMVEANLTANIFMLLVKPELNTSTAWTWHWAIDRALIAILGLLFHLIVWLGASWFLFKVRTEI